jgi:hypothetical protein
MRAARRWTALLPALLAVNLLATAAPAWAHQRAPVVPADATDVAPAVSGPAARMTAPAVADPTVEGAAATTTVTAAPAESSGASAEGPPLAGLCVLALSALGLGFGIPAPRRAACLTVAALLALLVFETGLHSVHHLDQPEGATACAIASVASHLAAVDADAVVHVHASLFAAGAAIDREARGSRALVGRWDEGRAPPTSLL